MDEALEERLAKYLAIDPDKNCKNEILQLMAIPDVASIDKLLSSRLAFGTAGLRGPMGAGYCRMNMLTVLQTTQGLAKYLVECFGLEELKRSGVIIGYDHRQKGSLSSIQFARMASACFLHMDIKVYLLEGFVPTPFVAYGVTLMKCKCGIMVTASHNPKGDNGYKVYWDNGAQIIPPHDSGISRHIDANLDPWPTHGQETGAEPRRYDTSDGYILNHTLTEDVTSIVCDSYMNAIQGESCYDDQFKDREGTVKMAYTAMHGVGSRWIHQAFETCGHDTSLFLTVPSQDQPDPSFPTVSYPNPEEKGALNEAYSFAIQNECDVILANDPDADRLAVAEINEEYLFLKNGMDPAAQAIVGDGIIDKKFPTDESKFYRFSGNEIGILLAHWLIMGYKNKQNIVSQLEGEMAKMPAEDPSKPLLQETINTLRQQTKQKGAVLTTVVSSRMLSKIAEEEGLEYYDTLTGFKWIGNRALELTAEEAGPKVLFSYEEALGYCCGDLLCDKDGIQAAVVMANLIKTLKKGKNFSLQNHLFFLKMQYGDYQSYNTYVFSHDKEVTATIFKRIRTEGDGNSYISMIAGVKVSAVLDVTLGYDSTTSDKKATLPLTPETEHIMFSYDNGVSVTLRTSGTEPKIKVYSEIAGEPGKVIEEAESLKDTLKAFVLLVMDEMLQPEKNRLQPAH